ncbi:MAG: leucine-rich repeat protein, partial [Clostridia bacterium]|nr:leucine-rich repeat protein [Clostridia bacterium]
MLKTKKRNWLLTLGTIFAILFAIVGGVLMLGTRSALGDPAHSDSPAVVKADEPTGGSLSETVSWSYDSENHRLTVSGTGAIPSVNWSDLLDTTEVTELVIGEGITSIPSYCFGDSYKSDPTQYAWKSLTTVTIPETLTTMGSSAFKNARYLRTLYYNAIDCQSGYRTEAFDYCGRISNGYDIIFGDKVKHVGSYMFSQVDARNYYYGLIRRIYFSSSIESIGSGAFYYQFANEIYVNNIADYLRIKFDSSGAHPGTPNDNGSV